MDVIVNVNVNETAEVHGHTAVDCGVQGAHTLDCGRNRDRVDHWQNCGMNADAQS